MNSCVRIPKVDRSDVLNKEQTPQGRFGFALPAAVLGNNMSFPSPPPPGFPPIWPPDPPPPPLMCESHAHRSALQMQPFFDEWENRYWPRGLKICYYSMMMAWAFMGVSIIADIFMSAIDEVTMATYIKTDKKTGKKRVCKVWCAVCRRVGARASLYGRVQRAALVRT